jgi:hypothetical protein
MFKQSVSLVEFSRLYNILYEIKSIIPFNFFNYEDSEEFISKIDSNNLKYMNSTIVVRRKDNLLLSNTNIDNNTILVLDDLPLKIEKILDRINTQLIKQKYNFQSKLQIKSYILNLNSRIISSKKDSLKLTEKEIDVILFLKNQNNPQSVNVLQNKVWGYAFDLETHTVETHIYRLRKKIKDKFHDDNFIISHDDGYKI